MSMCLSIDARMTDSSIIISVKHTAVCKDSPMKRGIGSMIMIG